MCMACFRSSLFHLWQCSNTGVQLLVWLMARAASASAWALMRRVRDGDTGGELESQDWGSWARFVGMVEVVVIGVVLVMVFVMFVGGEVMVCLCHQSARHSHDASSMTYFSALSVGALSNVDNFPSYRDL